MNIIHNTTPVMNNEWEFEWILSDFSSKIYLNVHVNVRYVAFIKGHIISSQMDMW